MMKKRAASIFLSLCLLFSLTPATYAVSTEKFTNGNLIYCITDNTNNYVTVQAVASVPDSGAITIPDKVTNDSTEYTVVGLEGNSIGGNFANQITSVSMPENSEHFTFIADAAFQGCTGITTLTIPASVIKIGTISSDDYIGGFGAFDGMTALTSVSFAEDSKLESLGSNTFSGCSALTTLELPSCLTQVGSAIVEGCTQLSTLTIPASVEEMSSLVFAGYYQSENGNPNVSIEANSKYQLQDGILYDDTSLLKAYEYCETVIVPEGITTIGENAFASGEELNEKTTSLTLPNSLSEIGDGAFTGCTALATVDFQNNIALTEIPEEAFAGCSSLKEVQIPSGVKSIGDGAFLGCTSLKSVELPEGLQKIGAAAFAMIKIEDGEPDFGQGNQNIKHINIPSTVTSLGEMFLAGTNQDTIIISKAPAEVFTVGAMGAFSADLGGTLPTFVVPDALKESYKNANLLKTDAGGEGSLEQGYALTLARNAAVQVGSTVTPACTRTVPEGATLEWVSNDTNVATVSNGVITGVSAGEATITASIKLGNIPPLVSATCTVTVTPASIPVTDITLNKTEMSLTVGGSDTLTATVTPENATDKTITWTSNDPSVVTVENGVVTAVGTGMAIITAETGSCSATCNVTVSRSYIPSEPSAPTYTVTTPSKVDNGTVKVSPRYAEKGDTVTITVTPDKGYELDEIIVTDKNGDELKLTEKSENRFTFRMPASKVSIEVSFAKTEEEPVKPVEPVELPFTDVAEDAWYAEAVQYVYEKGLMGGSDSAETFQPEAPTTRAMLVTILYRLEGEPAVTGASAYTDVLSGQYYTDAVAWATRSLIVEGYNGLFRPNDTLTRQDLAAILYRYASYKGYDMSQRADLTVYTDATQVSPYAADAMAWANAEELITGLPGTLLAPKSDSTRAVIATILMRFCENVAN